MLCITNQIYVEDECPFVIDCPLYILSQYFNKNYMLLTKMDKFIWLMSKEDRTIINDSVK